MHCDRVFSILTRGPFPTGEVTDVAVELHLAHCRECRRLAEALRPLESLEGEDVAPLEQLSLPGYRGDHPDWLSQERSEKALQNDFLRRLMLAAEESRRRVWAAGSQAARPVIEAGRIATAMAVGLLVGLACAGLGSNRQHRDGEGVAVYAAASAAPGHDAWREARVQAQLVDSLALPLACRKVEFELLLPLADTSPRLTRDASAFVSQCCTQCHVVNGRTHLGHSGRARVIQSCAICHGERISDIY